MDDKMEIEALCKLMEEMAGADPKEYGKRQPGERNMYELSNSRLEAHTEANPTRELPLYTPTP